MGFVELFLIGVGLSMDAFAVSICKGLKMENKVNMEHAVVIALFFGAFQGLMPFIGWLLGSQFASYVTSVDHWVVFVLLAVIGGNMIKESLSPDEEKVSAGLDVKELFLLAVATSIDALAVGITFAFLEVNIIKAVIIISCTTFVISFGGVFVGNYFGIKYKSKAEFAGGVILILIGLEVLLEHLGIF